MNRRRWVTTRQALPSPSSVRAQWCMLLDSARNVAACAAGAAFAPVMAGTRSSPREKLADFGHLASRARGLPFPVEGATAALMAEAFLRQARALAEALEPERRELYAPAVAASAAALEGLLDLQRNAAADVWRRHLGEKD